MVTRRAFLTTGGLTLAALAAPAVLRAARAVEIQMCATARGEEVWFDPIGLWVPPGERVRWVLRHDVHTTTAYHPKNDRHSLRIPEGAEPWDSGFLVKPGAHFDLTLTVEGVYDYYCLPHEQAGMVGRIVVGRPIGPGALPFDYFKGRPGTSGWKPVPEAAQQNLPAVEQIMTMRVVRRSGRGPSRSHAGPGHSEPAAAERCERLAPTAHARSWRRTA
jgi:plastocyanin